MHRTIILVGSGGKSVPVPRIMNSEIWCMPTALPLHRCTRIFELHDFMQDRHRRRVLEANPEKVYLLEHWDAIPQSESFRPLADRLVARHGEMFSNTISYMVGLAIEEFLTDRALSAEDVEYVLHIRRMHTSTLSEEYRWQVPEIRELIGYAKGVGIDVRVSEHSILKGRKRMYGFKGYEYGESTEWK
jgi:hypothetical protein